MSDQESNFAIAKAAYDVCETTRTELQKYEQYGDVFKSLTDDLLMLQQTLALVQEEERKLEGIFGSYRLLMEICRAFCTDIQSLITRGPQQATPRYRDVRNWLNFRHNGKTIQETQVFLRDCRKFIDFSLQSVV